MKVNLLQGRFQPFTLGHMKCVDAAAEKGLPTVIAQIETKSADKKHPFTDDDLEKPMKDLVKDTKDIVDVIKVKSADIVKIGEELAKHGYEIASWACGTDRIDSYTKMSEKYHDKAGLTDDFQMIEVKRGDKDISATKVRNAIMADDKATFEDLTPKCMHKYYDMFQEKINAINEHRGMKSLSSFLMESLMNEETTAYGTRLRLASSNLSYIALFVEQMLSNMTLRWQGHMATPNTTATLKTKDFVKFIQSVLNGKSITVKCNIPSNKKRNFKEAYLKYESGRDRFIYHCEPKDSSWQYEEAFWEIEDLKGYKDELLSIK